MRLNNSLALALLVLGSGLTQASGEAGGLAAQLRQHYRLATGRLDASGAPVIEPGKIFTVRVEGIVGFAGSVSSFVDLCPSEFQTGELHVPKSAACALTAPHKRRVFKVADPVCITAIDTSESKDTVSLTLMTCERHHWGRSSAAYRALVVFRFSKGFVATASPAGIEEVIGQVLSSDDADIGPETNASCNGSLKPGDDAATPAVGSQGKKGQSSDCSQPADPPHSQPRTADPAKGSHKAAPATSPESPVNPAKPEQTAPVPHQPTQQPDPGKTVPPSKAAPAPSQPPTPSPDAPDQVPPIGEWTQSTIPDKAVAIPISCSRHARLGAKVRLFPLFISEFFEIQQI